MQFYLYSCQDLTICSSSNINIEAGNIFKLKFEQAETIFIYPTSSSGVVMINEQILATQLHTHIIFHRLNDNAILCEIKPFVLNESIKQYAINGGIIKLIENIGCTYIYHNNNYYGVIKDSCKNIGFEKKEKNAREYGVLRFGLNKKYIILFNNQDIVYCNNYIDSEITNNHIQIYSHNSNIFNTGQLSKYTFEDDEFEIKTIRDRGEEYKLVNSEFNIIYFWEAIKSGRFKYAYNKLSYELRAVIDVQTLSKYFKQIDKYIYLQSQDTYIALKNNKVVGIYHLDVKNNLINNIY